MPSKSDFALSWFHCGGVVALGLLVKALWEQYSILRHRNRPPCDLGWPLLGHTISVFRESLEEWAARLMKDRAVLVTNFLFSNVVMVSYPAYLKHLHKFELDGGLTPNWQSSFKTVLGEKSVLLLPGGKGHKLHKRLRGKILATMGPKNTLTFLPMLLQFVRETLDGLCETAARDGYASFQGPASRFVARVSTMMVTAGLSDKGQEQAERLLDQISEGLIAVPLNLGPFSAFGRAMRARKQLGELLHELIEHPNQERQNIVSHLAVASEEGDGLDVGEVVDTTITLLIAGKLTTSDALPDLVAQLSKHRDWVERVAAEPLEFSAIEEDSSALRVVRESLRLNPPLGAYRRECSEALDLGEHGCIPGGCSLAVHLYPAMVNMGEDFDPNRWTREASRDFLVFGGSQPHSCLGRYLAMLELQCFAKVLCREYEFEALDLTPGQTVLRKGYKDCLRLTIRRKTQQQ